MVYSSNAVGTNSMVVTGRCGCSYIYAALLSLYLRYMLYACMHDFSFSVSYPHILLCSLVCLSVKL